MTIVVPVTGSANWDVPLDLALTDLQGQVTNGYNPESYGVKGWSMDPAHIATGGTATIGGSVYLQRINIMNPGTLTKIFWGIAVVGVAPVAAQNWVGLYNSAGTRLAAVDVTAKVTVLGPQTETISVPVVRGFYWTAMLFNAGTLPQVYRGQNQSTPFVNMGVAAALSRFAINGSGQNTLPASITPASNNQTALTLATGVA